MANVKSTLQNDPETWDPQSIAAFEEYTQGRKLFDYKHFIDFKNTLHFVVARWKKLITRVVTYKDRVKSSTGNAAAREGSPIPGVEIYELQEGKIHS